MPTLSVAWTRTVSTCRTRACEPLTGDSITIRGRAVLAGRLSLLTCAGVAVAAALCMNGALQASEVSARRVIRSSVERDIEPHPLSPLRKQRGGLVRSY